MEKVNESNLGDKQNLFAADLTPIIVENLDQTQDTQADIDMLDGKIDNLGTATFGEDQMANLKDTEVKLTERPTSTADLLLKRAEDKGDFNSYNQ